MSPRPNATDSRRTVLVVGATGNQGGVVVDHLLASDDPYDVRALTRDPTSAEATALADRGVDVVAGDLTDRSTLDPAVDGIDAAFVVTNYWTAGPDGQLRQCFNVADALADADVDHVVFSGAGYHDRQLGLAAMRPVREAERRMRALDLPLTVLKPVWFMHNLEPAVHDIRDGTLALPLDHGVTMQMLAVDDVGRATVAALRDPDSYRGAAIDLAGDEHTLDSMADVLSTVTGVDVEPVSVPPDAARERYPDDMVDIFEWFNDGGYHVDVSGLEDRLGFELTDLETYLRANDWPNPTEPARTPGVVKAMEGDR